MAAAERDPVRAGTPRRRDPLDLAEAMTAAELFRAWADPVRVQIFTRIREAPDGEVCFCDLADEFGMPQSSLSHHLKIMVDAGILERERRRTWSWYRVGQDALERLETLIRPGGPLRAAVPR
ncbi:metalloregulator ArsR/SmtB family transcription factor [Kibdelosporangium persicum]|uniref:Arsenical resistance operon repressor n=1 Tax=Kibdelosporangium persicum TaxID=2698649 RepID=A0ABX2F3A3_9PSEU|nr:metalloregulator ArsR/SmtB family transcription factor [Kibdelosporangium persicum]NRN65787.1 Arsenical resistance operon repressor [Kibdelosporangium persicum]